MMECYVEKSFLDASGKPRKMVVCGVIRKPEGELVLASIDRMTKGGLLETRILSKVKEFEDDGHIRSGIFLGVAVCSSTDQYDFETGKKIALGRALNGNRPQKWVHTDFPEIFNETVLGCITEEYAKMIANSPEKYAPGFYRTEALEEYEKLSESEKLLVQAIQMSNPDFEKLTKLAKQLPPVPAQARQSAPCRCNRG